MSRSHPKDYLFQELSEQRHQKPDMSFDNGCWPRPLNSEIITVKSKKTDRKTMKNRKVKWTKMAFFHQNLDPTPCFLFSHGTTKQNPGTSNRIFPSLHYCNPAEPWIYLEREIRSFPPPCNSHHQDYCIFRIGNPEANLHFVTGILRGHTQNIPKYTYCNKGLHSLQLLTQESFLVKVL